jgi:hypothetical protein
MGTGLKLRIKKMRAQLGRIKAANVHNRAFEGQRSAATFRCRIPETSVLEPIGRGLLGPPVKPGDDSGA